MYCAEALVANAIARHRASTPGRSGRRRRRRDVNAFGAIELRESCDVGSRSVSRCGRRLPQARADIRGASYESSGDADARRSKDVLDACRTSSRRLRAELVLHGRFSAADAPDHARSRARRTAQPTSAIRTSTQDALQPRVPVPPLDEQASIVDRR